MVPHTDGTFPKVLKIAVKQMYNFVNMRIKNDSTMELIDGADVFLIKDLSKFIGFEYELYTPKDGEWGVRKNGSWTGILGMLDRGQVDMAVTGISMTKERFESFNLVPYTVFEYVFVTNKPKTIVMAGTFQTPFEHELWVGCFIAYFLTSITMWLISKKRVSFVAILMQNLGIVLQQDSAPRVSSAVNVVRMSWIIATRFLTFCYCAVLLSFLTKPIGSNGIRTIEELAKKASEGDFKVLCAKGSVALEILSHNSVLKKVSEKIVKNSWYVKKVNGRHPQEFDFNSAIVGPKTVLQFSYGAEPYTTKLISSDTIAVLNIGLAVKKEFCCIDILQSYVNRIVQAGLYESYVRRMETLSSFDLPKVDPVPRVRPLLLSDFKDAFFVLGVGWLLGTLMVALECLTTLTQVAQDSTKG
ncbi:hypothetical protein JTE90_028144 [Oedothorax gibbosus]|uniref:Ionotropic glutamate receptor L-glutamate and glycine-binding domain-containing protein n=1 Tax=Oedothorax gibbosus TaxID=931172 RepID=A0AAV6V974_9ARAC|nr:hypothetical protein JTE90_028144 [Oedothorax gibbosus]